MTFLPDAVNRTILLDKTPECDGRTDGQNRSGYYSGLHSEECGRAVKTQNPRTSQTKILPGW